MATKVGKVSTVLKRFLKEEEKEEEAGKEEREKGEEEQTDCTTKP